MLDKVKEQKELMKNIYYNDIKKNQEIALKNLKSSYKVDLSIYGENIIKKDFDQLQTKLDNFDKDLRNIQVHKYNYQITSFVLFIVISAVGISGYWIRREYIPLIASILLLLFAVPMLAIAGLETTYTFLSIDFCSTIGNSIISGITPNENKGLGYYLSCPSKETQRTLSTAIYQLIINFDSLHEQIINRSDYHLFSVTDLGVDKRNNTYIRNLLQKVREVEKTSLNEQLRNEIYDSLNILMNINYILAGLLSMTSCLTAKNSINYIEEKYCYENHGYMFKNVIFSVFAGLGFIITAAGINKLIIVMRKRYSRALRGKKEFNTDITNEDDED